MSQQQGNKDQNLKQRTYHAIILKDEDPKNQGRYLVHIPELHPLMTEEKGIWVKNHSHLWRYTPTEKYFYGEYKPLQPGTLVMIAFYENDYNSAYIAKIISDQKEGTMPRFKLEERDKSVDDKEIKAITDRDELLMLFKTPKNHHLFVVTESASIVDNAIHFYYNDKESTLVIDKEGIHWYSKDNYLKTIKQDSYILIEGKEKIYIKGNQDIVIDGNQKVKVKGNRDVKVGGNIKNQAGGTIDCKSGGATNLQSGGNFSIKGGGTIAEDAGSIWLNSGRSSSASGASDGETNKGEDEKSKQKRLFSKKQPEDKDLLRVGQTGAAGS